MPSSLAVEQERVNRREDAMATDRRHVPRLGQDKMRASATLRYDESQRAMGGVAMKLSDLRNVVDGKLPNYRDVASGLDDTLIRLLVVALLPFVACMIILFPRP